MRGLSSPPGGGLWTVRLGIANSIGFSASTIMPLWIAALPAPLGVPGWQVGLVATMQLLACGLFNVMAPWLVRRRSPLVVARIAILAAAIACIAEAGAIDARALPAFGAAAIGAGAAFGVLLAMTNRIMAGVDHVQKGYAVFQIVEVCFASSLFLASAALLRHGGPEALFLAAAAVCAAGFASLHRLASPPPTRADVPGPEGDRPFVLRGVLLLIAMLCFFSGQSSINSFLIPIGRGIGLDAATVAEIVGGGMVFALIGAAIARIIGERFGVAWPIGIAGLLLAADCLLLTRAPPPPGFVLGVALIPIATILVVPYFFTALARSDPRGRFAAIGPAFLLGGVALGPLIATALDEALGRAMLGTMAAVLVALAALIVLSIRSSPAASVFRRAT